MVKNGSHAQNIIDSEWDNGGGERNNFNIKIHPVIYVVFLLVVVYFCYTMFNQQIIIERKQDELAAADALIVDAREESEALDEETAMIGKPAHIEKIARERLGMVMPGERVFVDLNRK